MTRLPVPEDMKDGTVGNEQHSLLASAGAEQSEDLEAAAEVEFLQNEVHVVLHCLGLQMKLLREGAVNSGLDVTQDPDAQFFVGRNPG